MDKKTTDELMKILKNESSIDEYFKENADAMINAEFGVYLTRLIDEKGLTIAKVARRGQMSDSYLYKICEGRKINVDRKYILRICFGLGLNADESQSLLKKSKAAMLYPRLKGDSIIYFCLEKHIDILECDKMLLECNEKPLAD